mgnify:CR=1 FL=1
MKLAAHGESLSAFAREASLGGEADFHHRLLAPGLALFFLLAPHAVAQEEDAWPEGNAYVRSVLRNPRPQDAAINDYSYDMDEVRENLDKNGNAISREARRYEVYFVQTRPVRRLVARNGRALSAREQSEVDRKAEALAKAIGEGRTVSEQPGIRLSLLLESFDFKTVGREERGGRKTLVFAFLPLASASTGRSSGGRGSDAIARILTGRLHVDEVDRRVARIDAHNIEGGKASLATGVKLGAFALQMEFVAVEDHVWLPLRVVTIATGRAFIFKTFRVRQTTTYSNYRRFTVGTEEKPIGS